MVLLLSREAEDDLRDILQYTFERWGQAQVSGYKNILDKALSALRQSPNIGHRRLDLSADYRTLLAGRHIIIYRFTKDVVYVVRILHESRDFKRQFPPDDEAQ